MIFQSEKVAVGNRYVEIFLVKNQSKLPKPLHKCLNKIFTTKKLPELKNVVWCVSVKTNALVTDSSVYRIFSFGKGITFAE